MYKYTFGMIKWVDGVSVIIFQDPPHMDSEVQAATIHIRLNINDLDLSSILGQLRK